MYLYILHFEVKLHHAQHYAGFTQHLPDRLHRHANARGSRLTAHLAELGAQWSIGTIASLNIGQTDGYRIEQWLKRQKNVKRYCQLCSFHLTKKIPGTTPIDREFIQCLLGPLNTEELRKQQGQGPWTVPSSLEKLEFSTEAAGCSTESSTTVPIPKTKTENNANSPTSPPKS